MRISDWSSDVCSSDLRGPERGPVVPDSGHRGATADARSPSAASTSGAGVPGFARCLAGGDVAGRGDVQPRSPVSRSEEHTSELQSLMSISYAVFCLIKQTITNLLFHPLIRPTIV